MKSAALYLHLPFCLSRCIYCAFNSQAVKRDDPLIADYVKALKKEMSLAPAKDFFARHRLRSIYFGGGTPSLLKPRQLEQLLSSIEKSAKLAEKIEISIEANPEDISKDYLTALDSLKMNRLSLGLQTTDPGQLKMLSRRGTRETIFKALDLLEQSKFKNYNCDILSALPGQDLKQLKKTIKEVVRYQPSHLSLYDLQWEEDTKIVSDYHLGKIKKPKEEEALKLFNFAREYLPSLNFLPYEISNFARQGYQCRQNLGYWLDLPYLGLGVGAHSFEKIGKVRSRWCNLQEITVYISRLDKNLSVIKDREQPTEAAAAFDLISTALRTTAGINRNFFKARLPLKLWPEEKLKKLTESRLINCDGSRYFLSKKGIILSNEVFRELLA